MAFSVNMDIDLPQIAVIGVQSAGTCPATMFGNLSKTL